MSLRSRARNALLAFQSDILPFSTQMALQQRRSDSWYNLTSGLGVSGVDKSVDTTFAFCGLLSRSTVGNLYRGSGVAAKIASRPVFDGLRQWVDWSFAGTEGDKVDELQSALDAEHRRIGTQQAFSRAATWARVYGSALVIFGIDDGRESEEPLDLGVVRDVHWALPIAAGMGGPVTRSVDRDGELVYVIHPHGQTQKTRRIHHSRTVRFDGVTLPPELAQTLDYWGMSVYQRVWNSLKNVGTADGSAASYLHERVQSVWSVSNLKDMISARGESSVQARFAAMQVAKSVFNAIILQKGEEEYEQQEISASGLAELLNIYPNRVAADSNIPLTLLYGTSPGGLNATGESDITLYYDGVKGGIQTVEFTPALSTTTDLLLAARNGPTNGRPVEYSFEWSPLWQPTELQSAEVRSKDATTDASYMDRGVLLPSEIRQSRFAGAESDIVLDDALFDELTAIADAEPEPDPTPEV